MKIAALVFLLLLQINAPLAQAAFYQWSDANGVLHFTDDHNKIPMKYRKQARKLDLSGEPAPARPVLQPQASPQLSASPPEGQSEKWWREHFAALRGELQALQDGLQAKQEKLTQLRRKRTIYQRGSDREAVNAMEAQILGDEKQMSELLNQIEALDQKATREGVPTAWRR